MKNFISYSPLIALFISHIIYAGGIDVLEKRNLIFSGTAPVELLKNKKSGTYIFSNNQGELRVHFVSKDGQIRENLLKVSGEKFQILDVNSVHCRWLSCTLEELSHHYPDIFFEPLILPLKETVQTSLSLVAGCQSTLSSVASTPPCSAGPQATKTPFAWQFFGEDREQFSKLFKQISLKFDEEEIQVGNAKFILSDIFPVENGRMAVLMTVEVNGVKALRAAYLSNSQGLFRVLPAINIHGTGEGSLSSNIPGYDKGLTEETLNLPIEIQKKLSEKMAHRPKNISKHLGDELLAAVVPHHHTFIELEKTHSELKSELSYERVFKSGRVLLIVPQRLAFDKVESNPDFSQLVSQYDSEVQTVGKVKVMVYRSRDGKIDYTFFKENLASGGSPKVWLGGAFYNSEPITSWGPRAKAPLLGSMGMPLWEYDQQIPHGYKGERHPKMDDYSSSWNFLKKVPMIQEWYTANHLPIP